MRRLYFILLLLLPLLTFGQNKDEELAAQYYQNGEFEKAVALYDRLLKKNPSSAYLYNNFLNALIALKDFDEADKIVKAQQRRFPDEMNYAVDRAWVTKQAGDPDRAKKMAREIAEGVRNENQALSAALALAKRQFIEEAEKAYLTGRKKANDPFLFAGDLAAFYAATGKKQLMVEEGVMHVQAELNNIASIQALFQDHLHGSDDWEILIKKLRQNIQKSPTEQASNELLMWALVQKKDFAAAFIQYRAIDKRNNLFGQRMMELAAVALTNGDFDNAVKCYEYVVEIGNNKPFYFQAKFGLLDVQYNRIVVYGRYNEKDLLAAEKEFLGFLKEYGPYFEVEQAERKLAHLYIFYLDRPDTAILILQNLADRPRINKDFRGQVKLELGDAYLMIGEVWDAELIYSQVDKDFKEEAMGQEAKFRMARLFYYKGEFERANAYLDVLKTATTQLISNNAIELSMLIQDNTGLDTTEIPMKMYADAELLIYRNKTYEGMKILDEIDVLYPNHALKDELLMAKAKAYLRMNKQDTAILYLNEIIEKFALDILADNALFMLAQIYDYQKNDPVKAMALYEKILLNYPASLFVVESRKRFRYLRGDKPDEKENQQIMFDRFTN